MSGEKRAQASKVKGLIGVIGVIGVKPYFCTIWQVPNHSFVWFEDLTDSISPHEGPVARPPKVFFTPGSLPFPVESDPSGRAATGRAFSTQSLRTQRPPRETVPFILSVKGGGGESKKGLLSPGPLLHKRVEEREIA
jgi:hypothetical protein